MWPLMEEGWRKMVESAGDRDDEAETRSYNWPAIGFSLVSARRLQLMKSSTVESTLERRDVNCMLAKGTCHQGRGLLPIILRSAIFFFFPSSFCSPFSFVLVSLSFCTLDWGNRGVNRLYNVFILDRNGTSSRFAVLSFEGIMPICCHLPERSSKNCFKKNNNNK